jgi:hypothetical protein
MPMHRHDCRPLFKLTKLIGILAVTITFVGAAQAADEPPAALPPAGSDTVQSLPPPTPAPGQSGSPTPDPVDVSAPASVPANWKPGIAVEQLPAGAYPEAGDGGIFGKSFTLGPPTRGIWGGSLWLTFHGLQWPYMPKTGVGVSGYAWVDTGYEQILKPGRADRKFQLQEGRAVLRLTPTYTSGSFFIQGQVEFVGIKDQFAPPPEGAQTDDLWVRVGHWNRWDLQLGRFESWEVFHLGMGLDVNTLERRGAEDTMYAVANPYLVRFPFETRPSGPGYAALHLYPFGFLRFELLGMGGPDRGGLNSLGTRPAVIVDLGMIKAKFAAEYIKYNDRDGMPTSRVEKGLGGGIMFIFDPRVELGVNASAGTVNATTGSGDVSGPGTFDILSVGGFANARIMGDWIAGAGLDFTRKADYDFRGTTKAGYYDHLQGFGALQYVVAKRLFIKAVFGYAKATISPGAVFTDLTNTMYSGRIRLMYLF